MRVFGSERSKALDVTLLLNGVAKHEDGMTAKATPETCGRCESIRHGVANQYAVVVLNMT